MLTEPGTHEEAPDLELVEPAKDTSNMLTELGTHEEALDLELVEPAEDTTLKC